MSQFVILSPAISLSQTGLEAARATYQDFDGTQPLTLVVEPGEAGEAYRLLQQSAFDLLVVVVPGWTTAAWAVSGPAGIVLSKPF